MQGETKGHRSDSSQPSHLSEEEPLGYISADGTFCVSIILQGAIELFIRFRSYSSYSARWYNASNERLTMRIDLHCHTKALEPAVTQEQLDELGWVTPCSKRRSDTGASSTSTALILGSRSTATTRRSPRGSSCSRVRSSRDCCR